MARIAPAVAQGAPSPPLRGDTILVAPPDPSWTLPALEIVGFNLGLAAWNHLAMDEPFIPADPARIGDNATFGWSWDDDGFAINQIGHPLQGAAYYSIARANGHGYLGGLALATWGSVEWEYLGATSPPSLNDVVTTRLGGAMLGETTWRLAELLSTPADGREAGWLRRSGAFLLNPAHGIQTAFAPAKRTRPARGPGIANLRLATGRPFGKGLMRAKGAADSPAHDVPLASTGLRFAYGDPFESKQPFDHFTASIGLESSSSPVSDLSVRAQLWRLPVVDWGESEHVFHLAQNYDYVNSAIYRLSANSFGVEWIGREELARGWIVSARLQPMVILLGAASTEYYVDVDRDYNFGWGGGWKTALTFHLPRSAMLNLFSDRWWIRTQSGAAGDEIIDIHSVELQKNLWRGVGICLAWVVYDRQGLYDDHPDASILNQEIRGMATWMLR